MSIQSDVNELNNINSELKRLNKHVTQLRKRKIEVEKKITEFLTAKEQPGVKYNGVAIISKEANKVTYKSEKAKKADGIATLQKYGISNPDKVLSELITAMKGEQKQVKKLKIQKLS